MSFFRNILGFEPSPKPGDLLAIAREVSNLTSSLKHTPQDPESPERIAHAGEIYQRRMMLAQSWPESDLDLLVLTFNARQAARLLQTIDLATLDESRRKYWTEEIEHALTGIQRLLEQRTATSMEAMGFDLDNDTTVN